MDYYIKNLLKKAIINHPNFNETTFSEDGINEMKEDDLRDVALFLTVLGRNIQEPF